MAVLMLLTLTQVLHAITYLIHAAAKNSGWLRLLSLMSIQSISDGLFKMVLGVRLQGEDSMTLIKHMVKI